VRPAMLLATIGFAGLCCAADEAKVKPGSAQPATGSNIHLRAGPQGSKELFDAIAAKDRQLFAAVFDTCDAAAARKMVVDDFEFFHDKDGLSETSGAKFAVTVQSAVIGPVVYVFAASEPPQPVTVSMWKPAFAVTVNAVVAPSFTVALGGVIVPDGVPTTAVTVWVTTFAAKFAMTVQSAMIAPVVYGVTTSGG